MRKRAQRSHYSAPTISHGEQCSVEGENGLAGKIRQYMVESYKEMHKETPTDKVEGPRQRCFRLSVHPSPSVSYVSFIIECALFHVDVNSRRSVSRPY